MAGRIRTIKPEILTDSKAARLSHEAWRLWVSTWVMADDLGRLPGSPELLGALVFWAQPGDPERALAELQAAGLVKRYRVHGERYIAITGWVRHQRINRPSGPRCPAPEEGEAEPQQLELTPVTNSSPRSQYLLTEGSSPDHDHDRDHDHDLDHDHVEGSPQKGAGGRARSSPSARQPYSPSVEAEQLADLLRQHLLAQKPDHALSRADRWKNARPAWTRDFGALLRADKRDATRAAQLIRWVFGDQGGSDFRFVVESPKALRQKWDRMEIAMTTRPRGGRANGASAGTGDHDDPVLVPRRRQL